MNEPELTQEAVSAALREVIDPEVGVNILDLGLVYEVLVDEERNMRVTMTMTTPACPLGSYIIDNVKEAVRRNLPSLGQVDVELVWDPPWHPSKMTDSAKRQLGWSGGE